MTAKELAERIKDMAIHAQFKHRCRWTFTLECGKGQTYAHSRPVLYGHNTYPRGSVLAGRPERVWLETWDTWEEAREVLAEVRKELPSFRYEDGGPEGGSTHIDVDVLTQGLPDEE